MFCELLTPLELGDRWGERWSNSRKIGDFPGIQTDSLENHNRFWTSVKKNCANFPVFVNTSFKLIIESKEVYILLNIGKIRILKILVQNIFFLVIKPTRESQILANIQKWSLILLRPPGKTIAKIIFRNGIVKILIFPTLTLTGRLSPSPYRTAVA